MNFINGTLRTNGNASVLETASGAKLPLMKAPAASNGRAIVSGVRPEHFTIAEDGILRGKVTDTAAASHAAATTDATWPPLGN